MIHIVTPSLAYGPMTSSLFKPTDTEQAAAMLIKQGGRALVRDASTADKVLALLGMSPADRTTAVTCALEADPAESVF